VATVPAVILVALTMVQFALAGHAAMAAANAARAAARAAYTGGDAAAAARAALPESLREGLSVSADGARAEVEVQAPRALPFMPEVPVSSRAELGPEDGVDDG
jgi:hypothetical protein